MSLTTDDLLDALREALQKPADGDGATVWDLAAQMDCSDEKVRKVLRVLAKQGRLEVTTVRRPSLDGRLMPIPAYRIKP